MCAVYQYLRMQVVPLNQYRYPDAAINKQTKTKPTCVLTCTQMAIQTRTLSVMFQDEFYNICIKASAIRYDGYIFSYERIYAAYLKAVSWLPFRKPPAWIFSNERAEAEKQLSMSNPVLGFLGKSDIYPHGHCVLLVGTTPTGKFRCIDHMLKDFETVQTLQKTVKRYGWYEL